MFTLGQGIESQCYNVRELVYSGDWSDFIVNSRSEVATRWFTVVETYDAQVALVYLDGGLARDWFFQPRTVLERSGELDVRAD